MRSTCLLGLCLALNLSPAFASGDDPVLTAKPVDDPTLPNVYVGFYRIVSGENDGDPLPANRVADHVVRITESMIVVLDADENSLYACEYSLKPAEEDRPDRLDMKTAEETAAATPQTAKGILRKGVNEEGRPYVMLCYSMIGDEYPEEFETRTGSETNLFVLEPIPDTAKDKAEPRQ